MGVRGFQWVESSEFQLFGRTSKETADGNDDWLGARYRSYAVAVAIPFLLVRSLPLPEAVTPLFELRLEIQDHRVRRHRPGNGRERTTRNGNATERSEPYLQRVLRQTNSIQKITHENTRRPLVLWKGVGAEEAASGPSVNCRVHAVLMPWPIAVVVCGCAFCRGS